tara:strand:- start:493 stop:894 length:402 start_codon:yes stop_codon:yes gene_type:complete
MRFRFNLIVFFIVLVAFATARPLSPSVSIRYDDILSGMSPSSSIGIMLGIDEDRYTGFDTDTDGNNMRLLVGWKWTVIGLGTVTDEDDNVSAQYTFGGRYEMMKNLYSTVEYVMVDNEDDGSDFLRIAVTINF